MRPKTATGVLAPAIVLSFCLRGWAAPAPSDEQTAKAKLEALEKKLPDCLIENVDKSPHWTRNYIASVRYACMTGPTTAKLVVRLERSDERVALGRGRKLPRDEEALVIYLTYYDGVWTTQRWEGTWTDIPDLKDNNRAAKLLMVALDELAAK